MKFTKMQGLGNDFVILDCINDKLKFTEKEIEELSIKMCDRHFGIGADGILLVLPSGKADIRMRIINSDGSEAEMCGNGIRCFARFVYEKGIVKKDTMTIDTLAGIMVPKILTDAEGHVTNVEVDMGEPVLERQDIPMVGEGRAVSEPIQIEDREFKVTAVSMGNPHCVIFMDDLKDFQIEYWGPRIEKSKYFPRKTNVEFVQVVNDSEVIMRVWERGAAVTLACGTGSCATATACVLNKKTGRDILLHLDGGDLRVRWDEASNHLFMTGPAEESFVGTYNWEAGGND